MTSPVTTIVPASEAPFVPSPAQMRVAETLAFLGARNTIAAILQAAEVPARTYYNWRRQPGFCRWLASEMTIQMAASAPLLLMNTMHQAIAGNGGARSLLFRLYIQPLWGQRIAQAMAPPPEPSGAREAAGLEAAMAAESAEPTPEEAVRKIPPRAPAPSPQHAAGAPATAGKQEPAPALAAASVAHPATAHTRGAALRRGWSFTATAPLPA